MTTERELDDEGLALLREVYCAEGMWAHPILRDAIGAYLAKPRARQMTEADDIDCGTIKLLYRLDEVEHLLKEIDRLRGRRQMSEADVDGIVARFRVELMAPDDLRAHLMQFVGSAKVDPAKRERVREVADRCEYASHNEQLANGMLYREAAELLREGWGL